MKMVFVNDHHDPDSGIIEMRGARAVEIIVSASGHEVWVNVEGRCRLRAYDTALVQISDDRIQVKRGEQ